MSFDYLLCLLWNAVTTKPGKSGVTLIAGNRKLIMGTFTNALKKGVTVDYYRVATVCGK